MPTLFCTNLFNKRFVSAINKFQDFVRKERTFKSGVLDCGRSDKKESEKTSIEFPKYVCLLKKDGKIPIIKWKIIQLVFSKMISNFCKLCFMEKY